MRVSIICKPFSLILILCFCLNSDDSSSHRIFSWGSCSKGQLGIGVENQGVDIPTENISLEGMEVKCLAAGGEKSAMINSYGELFTWGSSKNRSMVSADDQGYKDNLKLPTQFASETLIFTKVSVGKEHIAAITEDGRVFTMGTAEHGKLGHPFIEQTDEQKAEEVARYKRAGYKPGSLDRSKPAIGFVEGALQGKKVVSVACGDKHTVCVTDDGLVYSWGSGKMGALGHNDSEACTEPKLVEGLPKITRVDCGSDHTLALDTNGKLYSFGENTYGQLGLNKDSLKETSPAKIFTSASQGKIMDFSAGDEHSAYVDGRGNLHTWGYGIDGQLGHNDKQSLNTPRKVTFDQKVASVVCGGGHTGVVTVEGSLYLMGRGRDGQLGRGNVVESIAAYRATPTLCEYFDNNGLSVDNLALGSNHTIAVSSPRAQAKRSH